MTRGNYYLRLLSIASACLAATASAAPSLAVDKTFFQSSSAGFAVKWSAKDLSASAAAGAGPVFSASTIAKAERPKKSTKTTEDRSFKLLSLVGPLMCYQDEANLDWPGMVHPGVGDVRLYHAVDLRHPGKKALLTDFFASDALYNALTANPLIKKSLKSAKSKPKDLADLIKKIQDTDVSTTNGDGNEAKLLFNRDMLSQFCINKVTPTGVDLSISLYDQANNEIYPIKLSVVQKGGDLAQWLTDADSKKAGVLADKLAKAMPDATTDFHFDP